MVAVLFFTVNVTTAQGNVNQIFTSFGDWFVDNKPQNTNTSVPAGTSMVSNGHLVVTMGPQSTNVGETKYRADLKFLAGTNYTINSTTDKIIAVKFIGDRPTGVATGFKVEIHNFTDNTWINNGGSRYSNAGSVLTSSGNTIYYFDFSGDANYSAGNIQIDKINITIADVTANPNYTIDWIATFVDVAALEAYKNTNEDGTGDMDESALGLNDFNASNSTFKIYPNPSTNNSFNLDLKNNYSKATAQVKVYSVLGKLVLDKEFSANSKKVTINHDLSAGMYLVKVDNSLAKLVVK
ncbi:T9SS type A sorting domain-containing protein [Mariniflexile jejuense]|uniref:T9SS type A sorting domain-containing protein n=1 Tax=Mariniflexile jejuense TaxID=1173582 RepID=A0ABW3JNK8_9FLAO